MISRVFISQICLFWFFIFTIMSYLYGMEEQSDKSISSFYTKQESELIDLVFAKIMKMVVLETVDLSKFYDVSIFFIPPGRKAQIDFGGYLARFRKYCRQVPLCYVVILIYINRFIDKYGPDVFNQCSCYRIFLAAFVVAVKCFDDIYYPNRFYASVGGIPLRNLNDLERCFLKIMDDKTFVSKDVFDDFCLEASELPFFALWLNIKLDDFVLDLSEEFYDFESEFKRLQIAY